ncbi:MAG TPA: hypothetical protein PKE47_06935 [Verrucomicrobiota bacterium]|nr:hypothetical protein [Verrucomicrobiota bacterium]
MSAAEITAQVDRMTEDERFVARAYIQHLENCKDPAYLAGLSAAAARLEAGEGVPLERLERLHRMLEAEGL